MKQRIDSIFSRPGRRQFEHLGTRIDNLEHALHRELHAMRETIDERAFAIAELVVATTESRLGARMTLLQTHAEEASAAASGAAIEASREHAESAAAAAQRMAIEASREHAESAAAAAQHVAIEHAEATAAAAAASMADKLAHLKRELARIQRRAERGGSTGSVETQDVRLSDPDAPIDARSPKIDDLLYLAIEDRFRGDPAEIRTRQERYLPFLPNVIDEVHPLLDLGAGRGEWLGVLAEHGVPARGVDSNASCVDECRAAGLRADVGDLVDVLAASEDHSFGAISMFHVVEHLPFGVLADVIRECARVLVPGGLLIAETPNALNLRVAATNFWLDPTHVRPLHPELLRLLADRGGFARTQDLFLNEIGTPLELTPTSAADEWIQELSRSLDGPGDYGLLAWTPTAGSD